MYSFIGFMAIIIFATTLACGYAILKRIDEIDKKWKPSKEQMMVLAKFVDYLHESGNEDYEAMESLYEQLM